MAVTSKKQEQAYKAVVGTEIASSVLQTSIDWMRDNLNPNNIWDQQQLNTWVSENATPDEVFTDEELMQWAISKGYTPAPKLKLLSYGE